MERQNTFRRLGGVLGAFVASLCVLFYVFASFEDSIGRGIASGVLVAGDERACSRSLIEIALSTPKASLNQAREDDELAVRLASLRLIVDDWGFGSARVHTRNEVDSFKEELLSLQDDVLESGDVELRRRFVDTLVALDEYRERPTGNGALAKTVAKARAFLAHSFLLRPLGAVAIRRPRVAAKINLKIREHEMLALKGMEERQIEDTLRRLSFLRTFQKESYNAEFKTWLSVKKPWQSVPVQSQKKLSELYAELQSAYKADAHSFSKSKEDAVAFSKAAKESNWARYENLRSKELKSLESTADFDLHILQLLESFKSLDANFKAQEFYVWLQSREHIAKLAVLKKEDPGMLLGQWLKKEYLLFAPYSKQPPKLSKATALRVKNQARDISRQMVTDLKNCKQRSCYAEVFRSNFSRHLRGAYVLKPFSCLQKNPLIVKSLIMDNSIAFSALAAYYFYNRHRFDRFPVELVFNAILFSPALSEAYCRASFRSSLSFGDKLVSKNVFPGKKQRMASFRKNMNMLIGRGAMFSAGLVGFTYAFDQLFLALGGELARTVTFKENLMTLPFIFLHAAVWSSAKNLAFVNPLRHKLIPKLSESIAEKLGKRRLGVGIQTALDVAAYFPISKYNSWEYLYAYRQQVMPAMMGVLGISVLSGESEKKSSELESSPTEVANVVSETFHETDQSIQIQRSLSNGVKSSLELEKLDNGNVRLKHVDMDIPNELIEKMSSQAVESID